MQKILLTALVLIMSSLMAHAQSPLTLRPVSTYFTGAFDEGAAEIVAFDAGSKRLFFSNAQQNTVIVLDMKDPLNPVPVDTIALAAYGGGVNSVAALNGLIAVAVEGNSKVEPGKVVFFDSNGTFLKDVTVGFLPDMLTFSPDSSKVLVANEGEPNDDYTIDPVGSVSIIDVSNIANATVKEVGFESYNDKKASLINKGIRIYGPNASVAQDLEPEYIAVTPDGKKAYVTLQENNAFAVIDIATAKVLDIYPLGYKDHSKGAPSALLFDVIKLTSGGWPDLGTPAFAGNKGTIRLGGLSGLYYSTSESTRSNLVLYSMPDRGPNGEPIAANTVTPRPSQPLRPFLLPAYQGRILRFEYDLAQNSFKLDKQIMLMRSDSTPITGLSNIPGVDETPIAYTDTVVYTDSSFVGASGAYHLLNYDPFGGDFEGIVQDTAGNFWLCDEYRPAVYKFSPNGIMLDRLVPKGSKNLLKTKGLIFSEYGEGTSNNKYLEIYNGTGAEISLDSMLLVSCGNGCDTVGRAFEFDNSVVFKGRKIANGDVFVIAHPQAQDAIKAKADTTFTFLSNGNDWFAILRKSDSSIVDQIGAAGTNDPAVGWDVAGVKEATANHTLVRKHYILQGSSDWSKSAGTNAQNSEWIVRPQPTATFVDAELGIHMNLGSETIPALYSKRWANRGFEALAYDPAKHILYAFIQSPIENPNSAAVRNKTDVLRILGIDATTGTPVSEYVYLLERNKDAGSALDRVDKIGDAAFVGNNRIMVMERDSGTPVQGNTSKKYVYEIDLLGATNILGTALAEKSSSSGANDKTLEMMSADDLAQAGIKPVFKQKVLNLPSIGYLPSDKPEGLTVLPNGTLLVLNDNDFGTAAGGVADDIVLGVINFGTDYALDASDRDNAIRIKNQPLLGMFQPDATVSFSVAGKTYIATANEGDAREWGSFVEEVRAGSLNISLPFADSLKANSEIGRVSVTNTQGDLDGDGSFDRLYSLGARSFSIWDEFGNLVFDSGNDFETITAAAYPDHFNASNDNNDKDNRSDNKGPEPEAITIGRIGEKLYAFIGMERIGGIFIYDITNPLAPVYVSYTNNRDFSADVQSKEALDLGIEDIKFIPAAQSPAGKDLIVTSNEISGTISIFAFEDLVPTASLNNVAKLSWKVFPNPASEVLYSSHASDFVIFDSMGRRVSMQNNTHRLDIATMPVGLYYVTDVKLNATRKFIKK